MRLPRHGKTLPSRERLGVFRAHPQHLGIGARRVGGLARLLVRLPEVQHDPRKLDLLRGPLEGRDSGTRPARVHERDAEVVQRFRPPRIEFEEFPERADGFACSTRQKQRGASIDPCARVPCIPPNGFLERARRVLRMAGPEERDPPCAREARDLRVGFRGHAEHVARLVRKAGARQESSFHQERPHIHGAEGEVRVAQARCPFEIPVGGERLGPMQVRGWIAHLSGSPERLRGFPQAPTREVRLAQPDPRSGRVQLDRGLPEPRREIGKSESGEQRSELRGPRTPALGTRSTADVVEDPHPYDRAATFRIQPEGFAHPLERWPVGVLYLRGGRQAHGVTSRHRTEIAHSAHPGSPGKCVPKHS